MSDGGRTRAAFWGPVALVMVTRVLYLARFGWDQVWMNLVYFKEARTIAFYPIAELRGSPGVGLAFYGLRGLGLSADAALWMLYLGSHLLLTIAVIAVARALGGEDGGRRDRLGMLCGLLLAIAAPWSLDHGFRNVATPIAAAFYCTAVLLALRLQLAPRWRWIAAIALALCGALASLARTEALMGLLLGGVVVLAGARWLFAAERRARARKIAVVALLGAALGATSVVSLRARLVGEATLSNKDYSYYTFLDGVPWIMCWVHGGDCKNEHARNRFAASLFGSSAEMKSSIVRASLSHPLYSIERAVFKLPELLYRTLLKPFSLGPPLTLLALYGVLLLRRRKLELGGAGGVLWLYLAPFPVLLMPPPYTEYFLIPFAALLLLAMLALESISAEWSLES
jgi:hypothetical protein